MFGLTNAGVPGHRVGHAVDVVPPACVEADEVRAERRADLHQLEARLELLDEDVGLDRPDRAGRVALRAPRGCPTTERSLFGRLDLRQIEHERTPVRAQPRLVVHEEHRGVDDGRGEAVAIRPADVTVVEMETARAEDHGREVELRAPVVDDAAAEERLRPRVHLDRHRFGGRQEHGVAVDGQFQVALVVQRHRGQLAERVLAVEHPAIGAREQRVRDVTDAALDRRRAASRRARCPGSTGVAGRAGMSDPSKRPSRASCTVMRRTADRRTADRGTRSAGAPAPASRGARAARPSAHAGRRRSGASASSAARTSLVRTSGYAGSRGSRTSSVEVSSSARDLAMVQGFGQEYFEAQSRNSRIARLVRPEPVRRRQAPAHAGSPSRRTARRSSSA